jgi:hypothetical protein
MFYDADHPDVSLSDWQTFVRECPSDLIAELIDWSEIGLPDWFVPLARGVGIASDALTSQSGPPVRNVSPPRLASDPRRRLRAGHHSKWTAVAYGTAV